MSQLISQSQIERSKKEEKFVLLTAEQVRKDFAMFGMEVKLGDETRKLNRNYDIIVSNPPYYKIDSGSIFLSLKAVRYLPNL